MRMDAVSSTKSFAFENQTELCLYRVCFLPFNTRFCALLFDYLLAHPKYRRQLKSCNVPEEFFFQNIIMYSSFRETVCNNSLIFSKWIGNSPNPEVIDERDFDNIAASGAVFARKFASGVSDELFSMLKTQNNL